MQRERRPGAIKSPGGRYSVIAVSLCLSCSGGWAADYFDPAFLGAIGHDDPVDLSAFSQAGGGAEGEYQVTVYMNQRAVGEATLVFQQNADNRLTPAFTPEQLENWGVNVAVIPELNALPRTTAMTGLSDYIPAAEVQADLGNLRVNISVPQVAMKPTYQNWVDARYWEDGIPAIVANYSLSAGQTQSTYAQISTTMTNFFATLSLRGNVGPWRLHSTLTHSDAYYRGSGRDATQRYRQTGFNNTAVSRDIRQWLSTLAIGEITTGGDILDSVSFNGLKLHSNEQMLPDQLRGFSPSITGVANSNARVTVRQNGNIVYETYVAPGPFDIRDIQQSGLSGDYDVTVTEADGAERRFVVPYSSLPMMLRAGRWTYEVAGGRYSGHTTHGSRQSDFVLLTGVYGLPQNVTAYAGVLLSQYYATLSSGVGLSLGRWGALSGDITHSSARFNRGGTQTGQSFRLRYSKSLTRTGTSIDLTALRYSTAHYYNFNEFNHEGYQLSEGVSPWSSQRRRASFQTQLNQRLGEWGSLSARVNRDEYWGRNRTVTGLSLGYNHTWKGIGYGIYYSIDRIKDRFGHWPENRQIALNVSVPFSVFGYRPSLQSVYATSMMTRDSQGRQQNQAGLSGAISGSGVNYSVSQSWGNQGQVSNSNVNLGYRGSRGALNAGYSYSTQNRTMNVSANGGMVVHSGGVTLANTLGETVALVEAPNAAGVRVMNGETATDWRGYAIAPYLTAYSKNSIGLDPSSLPDDVELVQSNVNVYPTQGAVVKARFGTRVGYQVLIHLHHEQGVVPFGAMASLVGGQTQSIVGDGGQVYMTGLPAKGVLAVKWGTGTSQYCEVAFDVSSLTVSADKTLRQITLPCVSPAR